jgi:uncharacterized protein
VDGSAQSERTWAALCHMVAFAGFVIPFGHIVGPLAMWMLRREDSPLIDEQGKEAINFQMSTTLYFVVIVTGMILVLLATAAGLFTWAVGGPMPGALFPINVTIAVMGGLALLALAVFNFIAVVVAAARTSSGERFRYPLSIGFIR